jgi:prefoldin subunit 5
MNYDINNALTKVEIITGDEAWEKTLEDAIEDVDEEIADLEGFREELKKTATQLGLSILDWNELRKELGKEEEE